MSKKLTEEVEIMDWVQQHRFIPARVKSTADSNTPVIRLVKEENLANYPELEESTWSEFFEVFEKRKLALLVGEEGVENFNKLIER